MSLVPAFLDALVARLAAPSTAPGWQVVDGIPIKYIQSDVLAVGISSEDVSVESDERDTGLYARRESVDVTCEIRSWSGSGDLAGRRTRAYEGLAALKAVLRDDPTVGGTCSRARVTATVYAPDRTEKGCGAVVVATVRADQL